MTGDEDEPCHCCDPSIPLLGWLSCVNGLSDSCWHIYLIISLTCLGLQRVQVGMEMTPPFLLLTVFPLSKEEFSHGESCLWMFIAVSHRDLAMPGGHHCWVLSGPVTRRACDPDVSLSIKLKSEPKLVVLGWREVIFSQAATKFPAVTNRRPSRWERCSRNFLTKPLRMCFWGASATAFSCALPKKMGNVFPWEKTAKEKD